MLVRGCNQQFHHFNLPFSRSLRSKKTTTSNLKFFATLNSFEKLCFDDYRFVLMIDDLLGVYNLRFGFPIDDQAKFLEARKIVTPNMHCKITFHRFVSSPICFSN